MLAFTEAECAAVAESAIIADVTLLASATKRGTGRHKLSTSLVKLKKCAFKKKRSGHLKLSITFSQMIPRCWNFVGTRWNFLNIHEVSTTKFRGKFHKCQKIRNWGTIWGGIGFFLWGPPRFFFIFVFFRGPRGPPNKKGAPYFYGEGPKRGAPK